MAEAMKTQHTVYKNIRKMQQDLLNMPYLKAVGVLMLLLLIPGTK